MRTMGVDVAERDCTYRHVMPADVCTKGPAKTDELDEDEEDDDDDADDEETDDDLDFDDDDEDDLEDDEDEDEGADGERAQVLGAVRPQVARVFGQFREVLETVLRRHPGAPVSPAVGEQVFLSGLARQVFELITPTLVVELEAARANGMLRGETVDARFHNFLDDLDDESVAPTMLGRYPVLG